jgi:N-acetylglutamate synthase-like GNAT family acetyltransferase
MGIRSARCRDKEKVQKLLRGCAQPYDDGLFQESGLVLVAERQGKIIGVIGMKCRGRNAVLRNLAVAEGERGRGVGRLLVAHAEREAAYRGVRSLYVLCLTAARYFSGLGFLPCPLESAPQALLRIMENAQPPHARAACMSKAAHAYPAFPAARNRPAMSAFFP